MKQNPYPSILHTTQKSAFRQRGIGGSLLRTAIAVLLLAAAAACSDDTPNDDALPGDDDSSNTPDLVTVRFGSAATTPSLKLALPSTPMARPSCGPPTTGSASAPYAPTTPALM